MLHECSTCTLYYKASFRLKAAVLGEGVPDTLAAHVHVGDNDKHFFHFCFPDFYCFLTYKLL